MKKLNFKKLDNEKGLIPVVIQDAKTKVILMVGFMNKEAFQITMKEKKVTFWSRTRKCLWQKGQRSGNFLETKRVITDCDNDSLLIMVEPKVSICHTGNDSCFFKIL